MNFHQKLVVYYILDYFGILFILDINSMLIEFIFCDHRLSKGFVLRNILRNLGTYKWYFFVHNFVKISFVYKYRKYSKLLVGFTFNSFSLRPARISMMY